MKIAEVLIDAIDWSLYATLQGPAVVFSARLADFIASEDTAQGRALWQSMENHVFAQDDIFTAAEPTIQVLLATLVDERPRQIRVRVLDLLFHLVQAASYREDALGQRCLIKAGQGSWLLAREALHESGGIREACLEVLDICSPECAEFVRLTLPTAPGAQG